MATARVLKSHSIVACSNFINNCVKDRSMFDAIAKENPSTLVVHRFDRNAEYYYMSPFCFPTVKRVVYFGNWSRQDTDGLYDFSEVLVPSYFNAERMGSNFRYMTPEEEEQYKRLCQNLPEDVEKSRHIMTGFNSLLYFATMNTPPSLEILE
jgi:hypothetical protein